MNARNVYLDFTSYRASHGQPKRGEWGLWWFRNLRTGAMEQHYGTLAGACANLPAGTWSVQP